RENGFFQEFSVLIEFYNWDYVKTGSISNPVLDSLFIAQRKNIGIIDDNLYFMANPLEFNGDTASQDYFKVNLYEVDLVNEMVNVFNPPLPTPITIDEIANIQNYYGAFRRDVKKFSWFAGNIPGNDYNLIELNLIEKKWETAEIPGVLYPNTAFSKLAPAKYNGLELLCFYSRQPLIQGDFNHTMDSDGLIYFYLLDADNNVVHKIRYEQKVYTQISMTALEFQHSLDFSQPTFTGAFTYNYTGAIHPYSQELLKDGFFAFEFDIETGEDINTWYSERDDLLPVNYNPAAFGHYPIGYLINGKSWHFLFEENLDFGKSHFAITTLSAENLALNIEGNIAGLQFKIFPNPAHNLVQLNIKGTAEYSISDISGKSYMSGYVDEIKEIQVEGLPSGMYFIRLEGLDGSSGIQKIIKQ
ncbi:MAG: hypothetical protein ACJAY8_000893, partial [Sphingobacteriales bacterium]